MHHLIYSIDRIVKMILAVRIINLINCKTIEQEIWGTCY